ncbi:Sialin [Araneus ventricosus]|uniref:Sialin n=1 Tax=Araneus ventricosus TaxID=182803 RepID=A0A4Y2CJR1_ARAVE|nr:Sialin [Araneus ventricosus]
MPYLTNKSTGFPAWYTISFLGSLGILNTFAMCFNFNIMFYRLVKAPINTYNNETDENFSDCPQVMDSNMTDETNNHSEFTWDFKTQRVVLESFFYGFCLSQIPAGFSSDVYGGKWPFGISVLVTALACLLIPSAARTSNGALISVRVVQGMAAGISVPSINTLLAKWVPKLERSSHSAFILNGIPLSNVYTYIIIAFLLKNEVYGSWSLFYLQGTISVVWFLFWSILIFESPEDHKFLSESEVKELRKSQDREVKIPLNIYEVPWKAVMTSTKMWALIVAHSGYCWNYATLIVDFPIYFSKVLKYDVIKSSLESSLIFVSSAVFSFSSGIIADSLRMKSYYTITTIRKIMNSFAFFVPALCLIPIPYVGCEGRFIFSLQLFANAFIGVANSGFRVTHIDMCPELAGILVAITGTFGSIFGCFAVAYNEWILQTGHSSKNWKIVFFTSAAVIYVAGMIYNFFVDSEEQEWVSDVKPVDENTEAPEKEK